jgi:hypothetical protein
MQLVVLGILVIGVSALYALTGVFLVRRGMRGHVQEGHNDVLVPLFLTAGTLYAVLLAFLVIAVWESYGAAKDNAAEEASTLATLYRQTNGLPTAQQRELRGLLREYTEAVAVDEWPIQAATGGASPRARKAIGDMYRAYGTMPPQVASSPIAQEFLQTLRTVAADRNRRTLQAGERLPGVLWLGLLLGGAIAVGMSFLLYMEVTWLHVLATGMMAAVIGTMLFITLLLDSPFSGPLALQPDSFEHSLGVYDSVDKGN